MEQPPGWTASPENRLKNWLFCRAACGNFSRMAAKLRPVGRQTTPPEHAGELPAYSLAEQRNFFTGFREKQSSQEAVPSAAEARGTGTLVDMDRGARAAPEECRPWRALFFAYLRPECPGLAPLRFLYYNKCGHFLFTENYP